MTRNNLLHPQLQYFTIYNSLKSGDEMNNLKPIIDVDQQKCISCHQCIAVCPVKYCNDANGETVKVNEHLCIGCGNCIKACTHGARKGIDDSQQFFDDLKMGSTIVAIVAPAVASVFPGQYLQLNTWLKSIGVKACFDVSFGAELTVKSYLEHVRQNKPKTVIAQPCPALVTFIEIYHPELIPHLAPADSPMMHSMKMIKTFHPEFSNSKFTVISPCYAKKREFDEVGIGDYNVTMISIKKFLQEHSINLDGFKKSDFDNPPAERAVLFSTPGGLLRTAARWNPNITQMSRKIEGPHTIYSYLEKLSSQIGKGYAPLLIDCLNCELGCNGGTGTDNMEKSPDEIEHFVEIRNREMQQQWSKSINDKAAQKKINSLLNRYWKGELYTRKYINRSSNNTLKTPAAAEKKEILAAMYKFKQEDQYNCASCGYNSCENMVFAIFNKLNKSENCHYYSQKSLENMINSVKDISDRQQQAVAGISQSVNNISRNIDSIVLSTEQIQLSINDISCTSQNASTLAKNCNDITSSTINIVEVLEQTTIEVQKSLDGISNITDQTKLLSLNAAIEAVNAGDAGKSFAVVANEIKMLASETAKTSERIFDNIQTMNQQTESTVENIRKVDGSISEINTMQASVAASVEEQASTISGITSSMKNVANELQTISHHLSAVVKAYDEHNEKFAHINSK
jgi:methyl-accepting chemotaxis protein/ferredoxin